MHSETSNLGVKKIFVKILLFFWIFYNLVSFAFTWDLDLSTQNATSTWSNQSIISVSTWSITKYINENNDSETIWNYFEWYYYDTVFWFFKLDWSWTWSNNVRVVSSTYKCDSWYWYKLWWYAYSEYAGLIDFDYDNDIFVYYCEDDSELHWFAYSENNWFQNFDGIGLSNIVITTTNIPEMFQNSGDPFFVNNNTLLLENKYDIFTNEVKWKITNIVNWELKNVDTWKETIFYVLKTK